MRAARVLGLLVLALVLLVLIVSDVPAQIPGVKVQPGIRPPAPPVPAPPPPVLPKGNPGAPAPGGNPMDPKNPGSTPGGSTSGGTAPKVDKKRDAAKWPKEINGKTVDDCVREMRSNPDPVIRESAVRTLPMYGPVGRDKGADNLLYAVSRDPDISVRIAAIQVAPTVFAGYAEANDQPLMDGLGALVAVLDDPQTTIRQEGIMAVANIGPYMRTAKPSVISKLVFRSKEGSSYQLRRSAVAALAAIGQGAPPATEGGRGIDPDTGAVDALLYVMKSDNCALVRREAVNGLIAVGPVASSQYKKWRADLDNAFKPGTEKDKVIQLWIRVLILRNDPSGLKGNEAHLNAIGELLQAKEAPMQVEACQAIGVLGEEAKTKLQGLLDLINDPREEPEVVASAMMAAAQMKSQSAIVMPVLQQKGLNHPNQDVRKVAQEAITVLNKK
jgi:hypothetical protein